MVDFPGDFGRDEHLAETALEEVFDALAEGLVGCLGEADDGGGEGRKWKALPPITVSA